MLRGFEAGGGASKAFSSRNTPDAALRPALTIEFAEPAVCGNAVREDDEQCDDGNNVDGDGCSSSCTIEAGTAIPTVGEWGLLLLAAGLLWLGTRVFRN
ncbi:MAG: IPTL-CTERM sorting domain-containing protein [bacterium]|nr:IPTL-CTERM sorting domain-containing protein [bacterium]